MKMHSVVSLCLFEAEQSRDVDDIISHMARVSDRLEKCSNGSISIALLKCLDRPLIAVFSLWKGDHGVTHNLPEASCFTRGMCMKYGVRIVESGWFELGCKEISRGHTSARVSLGDIVSVRRMQTGGVGSEKQEMLSYCCLAVNKAYFGKLKHISSYSFYDSMDGKQILGLGVWDNFESACLLDRNPSANPALPYWKALGAKKLCYQVFQVVYATNDSPLVDIYENPTPGFQL